MFKWLDIAVPAHFQDVLQAPPAPAERSLAPLAVVSLPASAGSMTGGAVPLMSSREIAELTGKRHDNVRVDIENMAQELSLSFQEKSERSTGGRPSVVYLLPKRETLILVSGYNLTMRARIIDRWQELEALAAKPPTPALPDFTNPAEAALACS